MIELRWVQGDQTPGFIPVSPAGTLQYREGAPSCGIPDCDTCPKKYLNDWTSVPTVSLPPSDTPRQEGE